MVDHAQADESVLARRLRPEHGRRAGLLHAVLAGAPAADRDCGGRSGLRRGCSPRRNFGAAAFADGRRGRAGRAGLAGQRAQTGRGGCCHGARRGFAFRGGDHGVQRTAGRAGPHLAGTHSVASRWVVQPGSRAAALVRHDSGDRLPSHRVAGRQRHAGAHGAMAGAGLRWLVGRGLGRQRHRWFCAGGRHVRADLQGHAACARAVEGCVDRRAVHRRALHAGQVADRLLPRAQRRGLGLRRGRLTGGGAAVGVLLGPDLPDRRGVHLGLCERLWFKKPGWPHRCARRQRTWRQSRARRQNR